jgi:hypothetical protein
MKHLGLAALAAACQGQVVVPTECPDADGRFEIVGWEPADGDVLSIGSQDGAGVAAVQRFVGDTSARLLFPLRFARDGTSVGHTPDRDLVFCVPDRRVNLTVNWLGQRRPGRPDSLDPLAAGDHDVTLIGTAGPDRIGADTTGRLLIQGGAGNDVIVAAGKTVVIDAGGGHDAVTVRDRGAGHQVRGGDGRDRLVVGGMDVDVDGGGDDDCVLLAAAGSVDGIPGDPSGTAAGFTWCGPVAAPDPGSDPVIWPDGDARELESRVLAAIIDRRSTRPTCRDGTWNPAPARTSGFAARRLQGVARAHASASDGYPGPQSDAWAGGDFVAGRVVANGAEAHQDQDGDFYDQRAMRAGDPVQLAGGLVSEAVQRCPATDPRCAGVDAAADRIVSSFMNSPGHCDTLMGRDEPPTGMIIAVGVHRQDRSVTGAALDPPGWFVDVLVEDDLGAYVDRL